jgi:hypothetical protein
VEAIGQSLIECPTRFGLLAGLQLSAKKNRAGFTLPGGFDF